MVTELRQAGVGEGQESVGHELRHWWPVSGMAPSLRITVVACRSGGTVSVIGVYGGFIDKFPVGSWMNRSITLRTGQAHVHRYLEPLLRRIEAGEIDPTRIITHRMSLEDAPRGYELFKEKQDRCEKVVLTP
ncbi:hypothetical protein GCM10009817_10260 [Terrabacter lapilli]|uniref:Zinc-binding dehydrogenase n=2 Tax=Terrabacter lapilli TaxID=436231 RepID=A0ABP5D0I4_9MICO